MCLFYFSKTLKSCKLVLDYTTEYNINTKPIRIDLLVIKKPKNAVIDNKLGKLFLDHNILEYKSPDDNLNVDVLCKVLGYAYLYKANEPSDNEVTLNDITITLIRKREPVKLLKELTDHLKFHVTNPYNGIYYVSKDGFFPIQIVISKNLEKASLIWLTSLTNDLSEKDARRLVQETDMLQKKEDKDCADSVLQVSVNLNKDVFTHNFSESQ